MNKWNHIIGISFLFFLMTQVVQATTTSALFQKANTLYEQENYIEAAEQYEQLVDQQFHSRDVYYNLGNCYYRLENFGRAVLNYERALLLAPRNADVLYNLDLANAQLQDDFGKLPPFFLAAWWNSLRGLMGAGTWAILGLIFLWLGIGGLALWRFSAERQRRKQGFLVGLIALIFCLLPFSLSLSRMDWEKNNDYAILLESKVSLKSAPDEDAPQLLFIHAGLKVKVIDGIGDWVKVLLTNGEQGWLPVGKLAYIRV